MAIIARQVGVGMTRQLFEYNSVTGYRFIPGIRARIPHEGGGYLVQANGSGFRCRHNFDKEKKSACRRILLFGDSFTAGEGVSDGFRFGDLLENLIPETQVYNFGLPGTGTDQQYLAYREFCLGMDFDLLLIVVLVENIQRILSKYRQNYNEDGRLALYEKPYFVLAGDVLVPMNIPPAKGVVEESSLSPDERLLVYRGAARGRFPEFVRIVRRYPVLERLLRSVTRRHVWPYYDDPDSYGWRLMSVLLREWIKSCNRPVMLVPLPDYLYIEGNDSAAAYQKRFSELAVRLGCHYHDPLPALQSYDRVTRRQFRFETDGHYTKAGHEVVAKSLACSILRTFDEKVGETVI